MIEGQSLFQLATRSQAAARYPASPRKDQPAIHFTKAMQSDPKMRAFWQAAAKKAAETVTISDDTLKRLDTARKSDNKDVAAEKYRQAKAKLQALRTQAQLAAATGDAKTLRRLAQEAAIAAREIATSARGLAGGIAATATSTASPGLPTIITADGTKDTAANSVETPEDAVAGPAPADADPTTWGKDALRKLGDDARSAIAQARGIIAFLANAARAQRKHRSDPEEEKYFNELQRSVNDAEHDLNAALGNAGQVISAGEPGSASATSGGSDTIIGESTTLEVTVTTVAVETTEVGVSANFLV